MFFLNDEKFFPFLLVTPLAAIFIVAIILGPRLGQEEKMEEEKTYLARVELPTGEIETYEVEEYSRSYGGGYFFTLMDGRTLSVQSNNVVVEEIKKEEEVIK